jgi:hypothetical protein
MSLPPVTLFIGPDPDSAWRAATDLSNMDEGLHSMWVPPGGLTATVAAEVVRRAQLMPPHGGYSIICLSLDQVTEAVQHTLLKTLEEAPPGVRFILSAVSPLPTVVSRSVVRRTGIPSAPPPWQEELKPAVAMAVAAAAAGDSRKLARVTKDWGLLHVALLEIWAAESFTGRFRVFTKADTQGYGPPAARLVLSALDGLPGVRPRLAAQAALGTLSRR